MPGVTASLAVGFWARRQWKALRHKTTDEMNQAKAWKMNQAIAWKKKEKKSKGFLQHSAQKAALLKSCDLSAQKAALLKRCDVSAQEAALTRIPACLPRRQHWREIPAYLPRRQHWRGFQRVCPEGSIAEKLCSEIVARRMPSGHSDATCIY